ncbi:S26 family signal peptidase [Methanocaldococcus indicus]|uniref:S26 family signal peptidase n=1 Tax=Methanocaldococcus indicus TaxID=213231 RepID=UPI003C6D2DA8
MYPLFKRGDLIVVENANFEFNPKDIKVGDIVVYKAHWPSVQYILDEIMIKYHLNPEKTLFLFNVTNSKTIDIRYLGNADDYNIYEYKGYASTKPVVHRVIKIIHFNNKEYLLIKGDNNPIHDPELVSINQVYQRVVTIDGKPLVIPYVGYISIYLKEYWYIVLLMFVMYYLYNYIKRDN